MRLTDEEMKKWDEMMEVDCKESEFLEFIEKVNNGFELKRVDLNTFQILLDGEEKIRLNNCRYISMDFIKYIYESEKERILEEGIYSFEHEEIDMSELIDEAINGDWWDWRKEVAEYVGNE